MNKKSPSLKLNAMLNGLRSCLNLIFPLITFPYISRVLSVNGVGIYNFSYTYEEYFSLIAGLGVMTYAVREGAKYRNEPVKIKEFASQVFSINIISTFFAYLLLFGSLILFSNLKEYRACIIIFSTQIFFTTIGAEWIYIIYEDYTYITIRSITFKIISIIFLFIFVKKPNDYLWYASITAFSAVGSNVFNYFHLSNFISLQITNKINWHEHLKPILIIFASQVAVNIYIFSDNTLLGLFKGNYAVGIYSLSCKIYTISQSLLSAILTVTIPRLAMLYGKKKIDEYKKLLSQLMNLLLVLTVPASVGLMLLSKEIIEIIAGEKYVQSTASLRIISVAIIFSIFNWVVSQCVLIPSKREGKLLISSIVTAVFNIVVNLFLIPNFSYDGTALSTVLSELVVLLINIYYGKDIVKNILYSKKTLKTLIEVLIGCVFIIVICLIIKTLFNNLILIICLSIPLSIFVYFFSLLLLKNEEVYSYFRLIREKIK